MLNIDKIADNLATQGFSFLENVFEEKLLQLLLSEIITIDENADFKEAGVGRLEDHILEKNIRKDKISWIEGRTAAQQSLFEKLEFIRCQINQNLMLGIFNIEAQFAIYKKGDFYKRHFDSFKGNRNRLVSLVIYLNKDWQENDGGNLNIYTNQADEQPALTIIPKWGNAILFLSEKVPHEVMICHKTRYSIAVWFRVQKNLFSIA